jgi:hypothetical protein
MTDARWHADEQLYLEKLEQQCNSYYEHHNKDFQYYKSLAQWFNIPILITSAVNALTAVALNSFVKQEYVSVINAVLSASTGTVGSIQLYMKINEKMANALRASILMKRLALKISRELAIEFEHRTTDGKTFINDCFSEFNTAIESGNPLEGRVHNFLAFTQQTLKEKPSLLDFVTGNSPRRPLTETPGSSVHPEGLRAKKLWSLAERARIISHFPHASKFRSDQNESTPGESTPEVPDIELGARGS